MLRIIISGCKCALYNSIPRPYFRSRTRRIQEGKDRKCGSDKILASKCDGHTENSIAGIVFIGSVSQASYRSFPILAGASLFGLYIVERKKSCLWQKLTKVNRDAIASLGPFPSTVFSHDPVNLISR